MKIRRDPYLSSVPGVFAALVGGAMIAVARWLQTFDDDRPDLGD